MAYLNSLVGAAVQRMPKLFLFRSDMAEDLQCRNKPQRPVSRGVCFNVEAANVADGMAGWTMYAALSTAGAAA
jgi:hypothetical protein